MNVVIESAYFHSSDLDRDKKEIIQLAFRQDILFTVFWHVFKNTNAITNFPLTGVVNSQRTKS